MNGSLIFVLCLVTIVMIANIARAAIKQKKPVPQDNEELEVAMAKIDVLEERIQVLERIITESKFDLKSEIDSL
jgi:hypothetical protein